VTAQTPGLFEGGVHRSIGIFRANATCKMRNHNEAFCPICAAQVGLVLDRFSAPRLVPTGALATPTLTQLQAFSFGGTECALLYGAFTGGYLVVAVDDVRGAVAPTLPAPLSDTPAIEAGFSWVLPIDDAGTPAFLGYEFATGRHVVHHVVPSVDGVHVHMEKVFEFVPGGIGAMTHAATFTHQGAVHLILYNRFTGEIRIDRIDAGGQPFVNVFAGSIQPGWTTLTTFRTAGGVFMLTYEVMTGTFKIQHLETLGATFAPFVVGDPVWSPGFTHLLPYVLNSRTYLLRHNAVSGRSSIVRVRTNGAGVDPRFEFTMSAGAPTFFGAGMPSHIVSTLPSGAAHPGTVLLAGSGVKGDLSIYEM
jgi:hypothetical protein